jgi:hypothetical protein
MDNLGFGPSNPYLDKSVNDSLGDMTRQYNMTTAPAYTSAMVRSGSFGNSGLAQAQDESQRQLMTAQGRQANDMRSNNYQFDQNFDRGVYNDTFGQNQQNFQNGMQVLGAQNGYNTQDLGFGTQQQNAPMNYYQGFSNTANGIGNGFGTNTGTSTARGSPIMGALGGAQLGNAFGKQFNSGYGNSSGGFNGPSQNPNDYALDSSFDQYRV